MHPYVGVWVGGRTSRNRRCAHVCTAAHPPPPVTRRRAVLGGLQGQASVSLTPVADSSGRSSPLPPASPYPAATTPTSTSALVGGGGGGGGGVSSQSIGGSSSSGALGGALLSVSQSQLLAAAASGTPPPSSAASSDAGEWGGSRQLLLGAGQQQQQPMSPNSRTAGGDAGAAGAYSTTAEARGLLMLPRINTHADGSAPAAAHLQPPLLSQDQAGAAMRLGMKLEQRSDVRRLVDMLSRRMRQAGDDLAAAVAEVGALQSANASLSEALVAAREELQAAQRGAHVTALEQALDAVCKGEGGQGLVRGGWCWCWCWCWASSETRPPVGSSYALYNALLLLLLLLLLSFHLLVHTCIAM